MDRRTALKNLSLSIGYVVSVPTMMNMLSSCTSDPVSWKPLFLNESEKKSISHLVDIIIPSSDELPGALDVNVPQFIDKMYKDVETQEKQNQFREGASFFASKFESKFNKNIKKGNKDEIKELFETYFKLSEKEQKEVLKNLYKKESDVNSNDKENYLIYKFLFSVRYYSLFGYYSSEKVGEEVLNYDPIPGKYEACVPLKDIGNAWSL